MKRILKPILSLLLLVILSSLSFGQDDVTTVASDPMYITMDAPVTIYVNVLSEDVLSGGQTIDPDSIVTAYTGLITSESSNATSDWKNIANSDWADVSIEMTQENDSIFSLTIADPATFYSLDPSTKSVYKIAFIARGTSNGAVDGQTINLYFEVFDSIPTAMAAIQPADPYATESSVVTFNSAQSAGITAYTDTMYVHSGLITSESPTDNDWRFVLEDWGVNTAVTRMMQVSDSIYRYYIFPDMHDFYGTEMAENIEKLAFVFRTKEAPFQQSINVYIDVIDTITIPEVPDFVEFTESEATLNADIYPNPASDVINLHISAGESGTVTFRIYNVEGKKVYENTYQVLEEKTIQVNLNDITDSSNGLLFYSVELNGLRKTGKLMLVN